MFAKKYLGINDAIKILEEQGITVRLFDLQDLAREGVITPLIYVDADFVNTTYPTGVEVEPKRINERHCFTRFNGYVICKNANLLDAYLGLNEVKAPYFGELFLGDTELMFEVVDCLYAKSDMVSNGKTGYLFYPFNNATGVRHTRLQTFHIKNVRLYRSDVEVIANLAAKSVDKQKIIDDLTSQLVQVEELKKQLAVANTTIDKVVADYTSAQDEINNISKQLDGASNETIIHYDDEPTHPKSVGAMKVLIAVLFKMAEYDKEHLEEPFGAINTLIQDKAAGLGLSIKNDFIARWIQDSREVL